MSTAPAPDTSPSRARPAGVPEPPPRVPWVGVALAVVLVVVASFLPTLTGWTVYSRSDPSGTPGSVSPLHSLWTPKLFGPGTLPALLLGFLGWRHAVDLAARLPWRRLLLASYAVSVVWMFSLALVTGETGIADRVDNEYEYLPTAREIDDVPAFLDEFVSRIPYSSVDPTTGESNNWVVHIAGHPPGATLFFVVLARLGLGGGLVSGAIVVLLAATTAAAVLVAVRALGAEDAARRAAPFLVLTPSAIWMAVSADALFAATAAWGMAALALAATAPTTRRMLGYGVLSGLVLGSCMMLSYGLPLLGVLALGVLLAARSWRVLPVSFVAALVPVLAFVPFGFSWWEAYPVLTDRYWDGLASQRPGPYWTWANLALLLYSGGVLLGAGVAVLGWRLLRQWRAARAGDAAGRQDPDRTVLILAAAGVMMVLIATSSQMSRAEVERIWLPFIPWITLSLALLPDRWRRVGLAVPIVSALLLEHLLYHSW
jgi:methylthioxylose transferase